MTGIFSMSLLGDWVNTIFQSIMLWLDSVVYWFAAQCYQLFMKLSMAQIFDNNFYSDFANRIYSILGVFMLFYLAYALLNALVDPDKLAKGDKSVSKLASNLVISLVILGLLPSVFEYAYRLQNYILSSNVIGSLVFGTPTIDPTEDSENSMIRYGDAISFTVLNTFLNSDNYNVRLSDDQKTWFDVKYEILHDGNYSSLPGLADPIVYGANVVGAGAGGEKTVDYKVGISTIAGIYLCYIMLSFTLDLGVRVAKLAFCQLIAPIPVIMRAMPGKKGTFDKWLKLTLTVFFEIFVRVAIMYISIYLINGLVESDIWDSFFSGGIQGMLALVIIILGILTFAKQAPKMLSDIIGLDSGSLKLGIGDKLKGNFLGKGIAGIGARALGFATGGIGGAAASLVNGAGFSGAAVGAMNGWKSKGMQFNRQRQQIYSEMGLKGKAGMFGGRAYMDNWFDQKKKDIKKEYNKGQVAQVEKFENSDIFNNKVNEFVNEQLNANKERLSNAERNYNTIKQKYDANVANRKAYESSAEYKGIMARFQNQAAEEANNYMKQHLHEYDATPKGREKYQQDKQALMEQLQRKYTNEELNRLEKNGTITDSARSYLNSIKSFNNDVESLKNASDVLDEARKTVNDIDYTLAREKTREFMRSKDNASLDSSIKKYQSSVKSVEEAEKEKALKEYLESPEGREAIATQKEAFAALERENKGKKLPTKDSGEK